MVCSFVGLYVALGNEFKPVLGIFAVLLPFSVGVVRKSPLQENAMDPLSVWAAAATCPRGHKMRKYLMLIFVKSKMSLRANLANKSANYKCPKIDES